MPADEKTHLNAASGTVLGGLPQPGKYERYYVLTLLVWLNVLNYCDRALLTSFANFIMPDLALTATQLGILTPAAAPPGNPAAPGSTTNFP